MNTLITIFTLFISCLVFETSSDFKTEQLKNSRVKTAYKEKEAIVIKLLNDKNIGTAFIFIRIFKKEQIIEIWAKNHNEEKFMKITQYQFCSTSGSLGPKRRQGDFQIPEGFYYINRFNPWSNFYLSLGINYPNESDRILGNKQKPGGDIFIHGNCVTIGCIPITDDKIKELYVFSVEAKNNGQEYIPVHIFPCQITDKSFDNLKIKYNSKKELIQFWKNLKIGFDYFEKYEKLPEITVSRNGQYLFK